MKIALYYNLPAGGAKRYIFEMVKRLSEKHTIDVYTLSSSDRKFCDLDTYSKNIFVYDHSNYELLKFPFSRLNWIIQLLNVIKMENTLKKIASKITNGKYDLVFMPTCLCTEIPLIIKYLEIPVIYSARSISHPNEVFEKRNKLSFQRIIFRKIFPDLGQKLYNFILDGKKKDNINRADLVLTVSNYVKEHLEINYKISAKVHYPGVDYEKFISMESVKKEHMVLSIGALRPNKAHDFVIKCVSLIDEKIRPCVGIAYNEGSEDEKEYLIKLAERENVKLRLFRNQDVVEIYNKSKLVIFASFFEGLGLVALESMSCGTPVIGVKEGGIRESIIHEKTGLLLERDQQKFAEGIKYLLENEDVAKKYGEQGRKYVAGNWSWKKSAEEMEKHFYDVIRNK